MKTRFHYKETNLTIICDDHLKDVAYDAVFEARSIVELKISDDPFFGITYDPYPIDPKDHELIRRMCDASMIAGVGPMAGIAGSIATFTVEKLVDAGSSVAIVENGGDIAFYSPEPVPIGIFADHDILSDIAFLMRSDSITGICSSSRTVGPSVSFGHSSISTVFSDNVILADCCATALGNIVKTPDDLAHSTELIGGIPGVLGCLACCEDKVSMFGDIPELVPAKVDSSDYGIHRY